MHKAVEVFLAVCALVCLCFQEKRGWEWKLESPSKQWLSTISICNSEPIQELSAEKIQC